MSQSYSYHKTLKRAITVIASEFFSFFSDQVKLKTGLRPDPLSIQIQSIDIKRTIGRKRELYLVDIPFSSDIGVHETRLFIKLFKDHEKVLQEASGAINLEEILKNVNEVKSPQLLYYSKEWNILVYEGIYADEFDQVTYLSIEDKINLAGMALPLVQGITLKDVDIQRYYLLLENTIKNINEIVEYSAPEYIAELNNIQEKMVLELEGRMFYSYGGGFSFGDFHTGNIMVEKTVMKLRNQNNKIDNIRIWLIDPEFFDSESPNHDKIDRMEDIAGIFTGILLSEFAKNSNVNNSFLLIKEFIKGYNSVFKESTGIIISDCYPKGTTLEYHIGQSLLFDLLYYLNNQIDVELMISGISLRFNLINHILEKRIQF